MCLPFINAPPSDYETIFTSLQEAARNSKRSNQKTTIVTFDQQLYWKARDIVGAATSELKHVVVRLGGLHLLMSFMGSIGAIMSGSGIEDFLKLIYAENCVYKILSGHAYARAVRAHILAHTAFTKLCWTRLNSTKRNVTNSMTTRKIFLIDRPS
ncbi:unnamed protein product [Colias eurytheme]|nr:unnamed protein product [Colias eurytheme]